METEKKLVPMMPLFEVGDGGKAEREWVSHLKVADMDTVASINARGAASSFLKHSITGDVAAIGPGSLGFGKKFYAHIPRSLEPGVAELSEVHLREGSIIWVRTADGVIRMAPSASSGRAVLPMTWMAHVYPIVMRVAHLVQTLHRDISAPAPLPVETAHARISPDLVRLLEGGKKVISRKKLDKAIG